MAEAFIWLLFFIGFLSSLLAGYALTKAVFWLKGWEWVDD